MKKKQVSLSEQILALSNPTPAESPDDFWDENTTAKVAEFDEVDEVDEEVAKPSALRKKTAHRALDEDTRYKGLKTSRQNWSSSGQEEDDTNDYEEDDDEEGDEVEEEEDDDEDDALMAEKIREMTRKLKGKGRNEESLTDKDSSMDDDDDDDLNDEESLDDDVSFDDEEDDDDDEDDDEEEDDDDDEEEEDEEDGGIEGFSQINASEEVEKGKAVQSQLGLWDSFMETRIKLQKALHLSNQLPQCQTLDRFMEEEDDGAELQVTLKQSEKVLTRLMQSLISLQDTLLEQNPETQHVIHGETPGKQAMNADEEDDDEEIPSDTDDEEEDEKPKTPAPEVERKSLKRKLDPSEFGEHLAKHHKNFESFRSNTIQKWYEKTRLSTGKLNKKSFSGFERSALLQIQQILQDQNRLVQRTQLKRSEFTVLGQRSQVESREEESGDEETQDIPETANQHLKNYDPEIFDDDDFYHQLLRELIERRTSSTTDPIQLTRQWLQVQKLRTKVKRKVDTKASKGRKVRYDVHQKLVSFMAPEDTSPMLSEARMELFKSIFGQSIAEEETAR